MRQSRHINVLHFEELRDGLNTVLEGKDSLSCGVAEAASEKSLVVRKILGKLIAKLETLMELDLGFNLGSDDGDGQETGEVLR